MTSPNSPNILYIVMDDCGYADLSCTGQTDYRTPNMDRLAQEGARFTEAYANAPLCTNTRVAIITGRYQYRLHIGLVEPLRQAFRDDPDMGIPTDYPTLPKLLNQGGYATALFGKWHLGFLPRFGPLRSGYESFFGIMGGFAGYYSHRGEGAEHDLYEGEVPVERQGYLTDLLSERAADYIRSSKDRDRPYFLSLHYTAPHWPWSAPSVEAAARLREMDPAEIAEGGNLRIYGEMMQCLDAGIGRVMAAVAARANGRDTLVLLTSDNGGERFSKMWPFVGRKWDLLEGGLRVPQIVWWPGRIRGAQILDQVSITMDLTATCLSAAGISAHPHHPLDGDDLLPVLTGQRRPYPRTLYWRMANRAQRAVRDGDWKYLKVADKEFLFDIAYDPRERGNLARKKPELLAALRKKWEDWAATMLPIPERMIPPTQNLPEMLW